MHQAEKELIEEKFKGVIALIQSSNDINNLQHEELIKQQGEILAQVLITNGRVTKVEKITWILKIVKEYPYISLLCLVGLWAILSTFGLNDIISLFK